MTTDVQQLMSVAVLEEAQVIVEAELLRLTPDWGQWERELAEFLARLPSPKLRPAQGGNTATAVRRRPTAIPPKPTLAAWPVGRPLAATVSATQRSPPAAAPGPQMLSTTEVMP